MNQRSKHKSTSGGSSPFRLPPQVSFRKERLAGNWVYVFRHAKLGTLGRIVLQGRPDGNTQVSCEVVGDPEDPMTEKRAAIFRPLGLEIVRRMDTSTGGSGTGHSAQAVEPPTTPHEAPQGVHGKHIQCEKCDQFVALLIFADEARDQGGLEDYARLMYPTIVEANVPTWVIGAPTGRQPLPERPAPTMKIWPERESVRMLTPGEFNVIIDALAKAHCDHR